jgi:hypothetical protein
MVLREEIVTTEEQHDLDGWASPRPRDEKLRAQKERLQRAAEDDRMAKLYRRHVLKEEPSAELVTIGGGGGEVLAKAHK